MTNTLTLAPYRPRMAMGSLEDPEALGRVLAASGYFQDAREAAQAVVKVLAGAELGFGPIASMTGVYIVKGRVTLSANLIAASIKRHPRYDFRVRDLNDSMAAVTFLDAGKEAGTSEFTMDDARKAGLAGGENWKKYPRNMLFARAISNGAKFFCPDVFAGAPVYTPDELGAEIDPETGELLTTPEVIPAAPASSPGAQPASIAREPVSGEPAPAGNDADTGADARPGNSASADTAPLPAPPGDNADDPATEAELAKLHELLEALQAPETFLRMAVMSAGKASAEDLTRGEVHAVLERANARFGA